MWPIASSTIALQCKYIIQINGEEDGRKNTTFTNSIRSGKGVRIGTRLSHLQLLGRVRGEQEASNSEREISMKEFLKKKSMVYSIKSLWYLTVQVVRVCDNTWFVVSHSPYWLHILQWEWLRNFFILLVRICYCVVFNSNALSWWFSAEF